ncbi:bifunctional DNA-binding transcriptional regulator/O6-methylguanine-DNA methyltransferase Ada [Methylobacterium sp. Leaf108]|uniref:bifunctional DNA-binding transcriptional regulator/O6-methylguanine-DNA methyltransferase Ada n=1 Tax=Methylobacterium sp. Leaf108 TaxID=1736256 RepID=UPI0006F59A08|nr:bifunctional DNA-binding transcriptional regulator/O6-methylguanine-DNA methyltransferase Ada [Methylobacterium sp. Leaf108]KQP61746.1 6-O-methylguanine DNA methyltransferase [Methylobacterium sp. Leaf108]
MTGAQDTIGQDTARWQALLARDAAADGTFVYGVRSTGVFCRPSCPARRPRRDRVSFHADAAEARAAGFRPCLRCRPDGESLTERHAVAVTRACRRIEAAEEPPDLDALARDAGMSRFHFHRVFKAATGVTPRAYGAAVRARRVAGALPDAGTITQAVHAAGYGAASAFYAEAKGRLGMAPSRYRGGGAGTRIRFALGACSLGAILVAATEVGVCAVLLGDDPDVLLRDLQDRFGRADLVGGDPAFETLVARVVGLVEAPALGADLPLDIGGTAFQQRVWAALRRIPAGRTATYAEIAAAIGQPGASRAVGMACGANAIAVAIPCHRVVRGDGTLSGYRWGIDRKRALLAREGAVAEGPDPMRIIPSPRG